MLPENHPRHLELMEVALRRSLRAVGRTAPNPPVGAVIARDGRILSVGYTTPAGGPHAEIQAIRNAKESIKNADLYVTLEPCSHHGRTPPCADALIAAGIGRCFVATRDPNPKVNGSGIEKVRAAGIPVVEGLHRDHAVRILTPFFRWIQTGMPSVILKAATSLDGRIATSTGQSFGLSGARAQSWLHRLRDRCNAILVGVGTVLADDPLLTPRRPPLRDRGSGKLTRVIVDTHLRTPLTARLFTNVDTHPVWIFCGPGASPELELQVTKLGAQVFRTPIASDGRVQLHEVLKKLGQAGMLSVLVEGGAHIHASLLGDRLAHQMMLLVTPRLLGSNAIPVAYWNGPSTLNGAAVLDDLNVRRLGPDTLFEGTVRYPIQNSKEVVAGN